MVGVGELQQISLEWKEKKMKEEWAIDTMKIHTRGSAMRVEGDSNLAELCIAAVDVTNISMEKCVNLRALEIRCPLVGDKDVVLPSSVDLRSMVTTCRGRFRGRKDTKSWTHNKPHK